MASVDIKVPLDLWESEEPGSIVLWLYADGAQVRQGDVIAEILVAKATIELEAPASGKLQILVQPEIPLAKGDVIGTIAS